MNTPYSPLNKKIYSRLYSIDRVDNFHSEIANAHIEWKQHPWNAIAGKKRKGSVQ